MTTATEPARVDGWPWPDEIALGQRQDVLHRVHHGAVMIEMDGVTYSVADCGAVAILTSEPPDDMDFCVQCWPCGLPVLTRRPDLGPPPTPATLPACLDWDKIDWAAPAHRTKQLSSSADNASVLTAATARVSNGSTSAPKDVGWFELTT